MIFTYKIAIQCNVFLHSNIYFNFFNLIVWMQPIQLPILTHCTEHVKI